MTLKEVATGNAKAEEVMTAAQDTWIEVSQYHGGSNNTVSKNHFGFGY